MKKVLFIDACARPDSRTLELAETVLQKVDGCVERLPLYQTPLQAVGLRELEARDCALKDMCFEDPLFDLARQFAAADSIVIAAPYWDMMFPSVLKTYLEAVTVCGMTFRYSAQGRPQGLCKATSLYYVTTAGGFIGQNDFGFSYIKAIAQNFFGIAEVHRFAAEGLDIAGANVSELLNNAKAAVNEELA